MKTKDRDTLENVIFKDLCIRGRYSKILFVGCRSYTAWYVDLFFSFGIEFHTVDPDPAAAKYGAKCHFVCAFQDLDLERLSGKYDLIIINGVFNYGIDTLEAKRDALQVAHQLLESGGHFLVGFRDNTEVRDIDREMILKVGFISSVVPGFCEHYIPTYSKNGHAFESYVRPRNE